MAENVPKLGALITGEAERDAVHVAVVPVEVVRPMKPGAHVGVSGAGTPGMLAVDTLTLEKIGVVDPFLKSSLKGGDRCYLFLYPGTVISLRHHYRHPVLDHEEIRRETIELLTGASKKFITECAGQIGLTYDDLMAMAKTWLTTGEAVNWDQSMASGWSDEEFWTHYEILTGATLPPEKKQYFLTCCM